MKTIISVICIGLLVAGCANLTPEQRRVWSQCFLNIAESQERQLDRIYNQQRPGLIYPQSKWPDNYWQERQARQEYWQNVDK